MSKNEEVKFYSFQIKIYHKRSKLKKRKIRIVTTHGSGSLNLLFTHSIWSSCSHNNNIFVLCGCSIVLHFSWCYFHLWNILHLSILLWFHIFEWMQKKKKGFHFLHLCGIQDFELDLKYSAACMSWVGNAVGVVKGVRLFWQ